MASDLSRSGATCVAHQPHASHHQIEGLRTAVTTMMVTQHRYSIEFKRQEYQASETLHGLTKRHGISRHLVRIWAAKAEAGEFDDDLAARVSCSGTRRASCGLL
ncbi:MAG: hypothetical protein WBX25_16590 [Rhodomicrobium sp.]